MRQRTPLRAALLAGSAIALIVAAAPAGAAQSTSSSPTPLSVTAVSQHSARLSQVDVRNVQRGATVRTRTQGQVGSFLAAHSGLLHRFASAGPASSASQIHPAQGTGFINEGNDEGSFADQSVSTSLHPTNADTTIYTPTMYPAGGSCIEVSTVYTASTQAVEAWDWCNHIDFEASVAINSDFISRYTNGSGACSAEILRTNASSNTWTAYLYDYSTSSYDTLYTSSGTSQAGTTGWDVNELYSDVQSNGQSYACTDMAGITFSADDIQVDLGGTWQAASPSNSNTEFDQPAPNFDCSAMSYQMINQYNHWQVLD
ncbi:MAG TPA: hypothetical protein VHX38_35345 [Pseudonocardiaceae bacterium]|jgi:hypothetical protein|nr:hypothetical protein [Pseudonocardiaceae bacterium]